MGELNFKDYILKMAHGEAIEAIVLGPANDYDDKGEPYNLGPCGILLSWEQALPWLDYSFGGNSINTYCHYMIAWTQSWVVFTYDYDKMFSVESYPRNPVAPRPIPFPSDFYESFLPPREK